MKTPGQIFEFLIAELGTDAVVAFYDPVKVEPKDPKLKPAGDPFVIIQSASIEKVCRFLKQNPEMLFDSLMTLGAIDEGGEQPAYAIVYCLYSFKHKHRVHLKVRLPKNDPVLPSVTAVWAGAEWFEREAFDLMGVNFSGHPDLRRIMLPPDWVGHPLRKDYEFPKEYNGISCTRPKLK